MRLWRLLLCGWILLPGLSLTQLAPPASSADGPAVPPLGVAPRSVGQAPGDENWADIFGPPIGNGTNDAVRALVADAGGTLYAGGAFTIAGDVSANHVARWDGSTWFALGSGVDGEVYALAVDDGGDIYAGGEFATAGGTSASNIARWDGSSWSPLGSGVNGPVYALALDPAGNLYAGGHFTTAGGVSVNNVARWDGSTWSALGSGAGNGVWGCATPYAYALATDDSGNLYVGGYFFAAGGLPVNHIARWDGSTWSPLSSGVNNRVYGLAIDSDNNLYVCGGFNEAGGVSAECIARWDGSSWLGLGSGFWPDGSYTSYSYVLALVVDGSGNLYAASEHVARWDSTHESWSIQGVEMGQPVYALAILPGGSGDSLYAGGDFTMIGDTIANYIARWDSSNWEALGSSSGDGMNDLSYSLIMDHNGNLCAGGRFTVVGDTLANHIAKWNYSGWETLDSGVSVATALAIDNDGNLYAGGGSHVDKWDGSSWSTLGSGIHKDNAAPEVYALALDHSGVLYAGGFFNLAGGVNTNAIAKWDGSAWSALLGNEMGSQARVQALVVAQNNDLYVGGCFVQDDVGAKHIAKWNGSSWKALGSGMSNDVAPSYLTL